MQEERKKIIINLLLPKEFYFFKKIPVFLLDFLSKLIEMRKQIKDLVTIQFCD
jgi:hypothetical protein